MRNAFMLPLRQATAIRKQCVVWRIGGGGGGNGTAQVVNPALVQQQSLSIQQARRPFSNCAVRCSHNNNNNAATSPLGPVGVAAALAAAEGKGTGAQQEQVQPTIWDEFALRDRVALVSGGNRGLGLEMALVLIEAGARAVYCVDLPAQPGKEWLAVAEYVKRMAATGGGVGGRLEYVSADVRDQQAMWRFGEEIGDREGRMDVCVAAAGILKAHTDCLEYPGEQFEEVRSDSFTSFVFERGGGGTSLGFDPRTSQVMSVNANGVLYTAQAAGRQMVRFGNKGSIILIASMSGSITNKVCRSRCRAILVVTDATIRTGLGSRVGVIQHEQIGRVTDGSEHGV